jgi:hypothetical protein
MKLFGGNKIGNLIFWLPLVEEINFAFWTKHFLKVSEKPTNASLIQFIDP